MNGWTTPAIGIFLISQLGAAVWWASDTDSTVKEHSTFIYKVSENDKQIAIMQVRQQNIQADIIEIKKDSRELKELSHKILSHLEK
tara:strand:+ start:271 stop:528 length:258 start_codon:yes stop_codon:yes gene_type:complete